MSRSALQLRSLVSEDNTLTLSLEDVDIPEPGPEEILVQMEAAPLNPSDLALLIGPADVSKAEYSGTAERPVVKAPIPEHLMGMVKARLGQSLAIGNEGAGVVVASGNSDAAKALLGKRVGIVGGDMYSQYRCVHTMMALPLEEGTTSAQGASCFVNPLTSLAMVETMRAEGHTALVHTAAASNLGQMLNRICINEGIDLVNIVRKDEQTAILKEIGAKYIVNSSSDNFYAELTEALVATGATLAFDATGGGELASDILNCMEAAAARNMGEYNRYGSDVYKQLYIYGGLDRSPTVLKRGFGFSWGIGGFLLTPFLAKVGLEKSMEMRAKVAAELQTTFASHYSEEVSLAGALSKEALGRYSQQKTGEKFLINPSA
ncbi:zinc-binding dehydrogenase [Pseudoteredinibacter isoporae]|uniref:NADPH:quinone reductase-like Zn-dependent oxidoreductase n=1 Tax=Pseudoteredinibacter isoporae TaxID=570281 RepID=A0A7X0JTV9_9GAMM|nr:zinc-binding dehydrogenase [Pseudoteredinibacter isoporae]MBB6522177.1 NADPH:quinone reductase-like Zn-dependent oxidoreductase [Pseudoteredinibacter isoporae]NHO87711.1 NADH oxidase [Pseudoteredinibacter isoporae]NIB23958.1 NADH oxidase [Pseudoteredinibacter isoporae]